MQTMYATWNEKDGRWAFGVKGPGYVEISAKTHSQLFAEQASGKRIVRGGDGFPKVEDAAPQVTLAQRHAQRTVNINSQCEAAITSGFWSNALGTPLQYSSQRDDQANLTGVILAGSDTLYACRDQAGTKTFRPHTAAQIRKVGDDFTAFKLQLLQKANGLKQQLDQALINGDREALEALSWESPQP